MTSGGRSSIEWGDQELSFAYTKFEVPIRHLSEAFRRKDSRVQGRNLSWRNKYATPG